MDLSKLPKLSDTKSQTPKEPAQSEQAPPGAPGQSTLPPVLPDLSPRSVHPEPARYNPYRQPGPVGGDIWFSAIIGLLLLYLGGTFGSYAIATLAHKPFHTGVNWLEGPNAGTEVAYFDLQGCTAWSDMGIFLFGIVVIFEAIAKAFIVLKPGNVSKFLLLLAIVLTLLGVGLNIIACLKMFSAQITPLMSGLAVAFGGWILFDEWTTLQRMKAVSR